MKIKLRLPDRPTGTKIIAEPTFQKIWNTSRQGVVGLRRSVDWSGLQSWLNRRQRGVVRATLAATVAALLLLEVIRTLTSLPPILSQYELGRQAYNNGQYQSALRVLRQNLAQHPDEPYTRLLLAQSAVALHQWTAAGGYLASLVRGNPDNPMIYYWIGRAQLGSGQLESAETSWNLVLARNDSAALTMRPAISLALGQLRFQQGRYAEASQLLYQSLAGPGLVEPTDRQTAFYLYGLLLARDLRFDEAMAPLQNALAIGLPGNQLDNVPMQVALDRTADRARSVLGQLPGAASEKLDGAKRARLAYAYILAEEYGPAEEQLLQVLRAAPGYTDARAYLGIVYWRTGRSGRAITTLNAALVQQPANKLARQALAEILIDQLPALQVNSGDNDRFKQTGEQAKRLLESLQTEKPDDANLQVTIARYNVAVHDYQSAQQHYRNALDLNKLKPVTGLNAGAVLSRYFSETNFDPCVRGVDTGLEATRDLPSDAESWYAVGLAYSKCGHPDLAAPMLEKALELRPYWPEAMYRLGLAYDWLNRPTEADRLFELLADLAPDRVYPRVSQITQ